MGQFITTSGTLQESVTICDTSISPFIASVAFDNENYFVTWTQLTDMSMRGRFFNKSGTPIDESFIVISPEENRLPVGGVVYGGGAYLVVGTKVDSNFSNVDVYARFLSPLTSVQNKLNLIPDKIALHQNYPNPFNTSTVISYSLPFNSHVTLKVFNLLGKEVATLANGVESLGKKSVTFQRR